MTEPVTTHLMTDQELVKILQATRELLGTQVALARRLGICEGTVSQVLNGKYRAGLSNIKARVVAKLSIDCPVKGEISVADCCRESQAARGSNWPSDPQMVRLYQACQKCFFNRG
ncbi:MAG: XRE family transcriptional regulator [Candidatus Electrothrix sp. ATG2]|nr:XRE family transcriptional regulator [Candidatus Electrothrix sp. ATG2]